MFVLSPPKTLTPAKRTQTNKENMKRKIKAWAQRSGTHVQRRICGVHLREGKMKEGEQIRFQKFPLKLHTQIFQKKETNKRTCKRKPHKRTSKGKRKEKKEQKQV